LSGQRDGNLEIWFLESNTAIFQSGENSAMTFPSVCVSRFSLTVDAAETITNMVDSANNPWGRRLHDVLTFATSGTSAYAVAPYEKVCRDDFHPQPRPGSAPDVGDRSVSGVLVNLEQAGFVACRTVLCETSSETYLSDGRSVTAVHVLRPFVLVGVDYRFSRDANHRAITQGHAYADSWEITDRTYVVRAGWYLVAEIGDFTTELAGVAGMDFEPDGWLFELEGFGASTCAAECDTCQRRWTAEAGSWLFRPDYGAVAWAFDDADVSDDGDTVACPSCDVGRVGFLVY